MPAAPSNSPTAARMRFRRWQSHHRRRRAASGRGAGGGRGAVRRGGADAGEGRQPQFPLLYSVRGFQYVDLLLAPAERAAWQAVLRGAGASNPRPPRLKAPGRTPPPPLAPKPNGGPLQYKSGEQAYRPIRSSTSPLTTSPSREHGSTARCSPAPKQKSESAIRNPHRPRQAPPGQLAQPSPEALLTAALHAGRGRPAGRRSPRFWTKPSTSPSAARCRCIWPTSTCTARGSSATRPNSPRPAPSSKSMAIGAVARNSRTLKK